MKVLLINPPRENEIIGNNPSIIEDERGYNPPLGLLYVAAYLEKYADHDIQIVDSQVERLSYSSLETRVRLFNPEIVGITCMTMTLIDVIKVIKVVKRVDREIKVILGGPHAHLFPDETINLEGVDYLVRGEGEKAFKELIDSMHDKSKLNTIPGIVFRDNGQVVNTGVPPLIKNIDEFPFPARHMVPYKKYSSLLTKGNIVTTLFTSRGCPFPCSFCDRPHLGKAFRARSAENVVDELEECVNMGIYDFLIYDDTFTIKKKRVIDICNEIIKRKLDISWDIRSRIDTVNEEMLKLLKKAGCQGIHYGVEAGTEKILKVLKKNITLEQTRRIFELTRKYKIQILAYFMIGSPTETVEDIQNTFKIMKELKPDFVHLTILTPFPGTQIYYDGLKNGVIQKDYWREFAKNPSTDFIPPHWDEILTRQELDALLVKGYKSFYMRPLYIAKRTLKVRGLSEFKKKALAGLKVFAMKQH